jgi:mono/diheme cytochrome c family protein
MNGRAAHATGRLIAITIALIACAVLLSACGSARRDEPTQGPIQIADKQIALGQRTFASYCYQCHPSGDEGLGPAINNKPLPGWLMKFQIRHGLGWMPAFSKQQISDEEADAVVAYLKALRAHPAG